MTHTHALDCRCRYSKAHAQTRVDTEDMQGGRTIRDETYGLCLDKSTSPQISCLSGACPGSATGCARIPRPEVRAHRAIQTTRTTFCNDVAHPEHPAKIADICMWPRPSSRCTRKRVLLRLHGSLRGAVRDILQVRCYARVGRTRATRSHLDRFNLRAQRTDA